MKNTDSADGDPFTDKVKVNLHVLGTLMLDGVGGEVDGADVVAVDKGGGLHGLVEFLKELLQPGDFSNPIRNCPILGLGTGPRDSGLALG